MRTIIIILLSCLFFFYSNFPAKAQSSKNQQPRTIAFVAGNEVHTNVKGLNLLEYVAEDAFKIWGTLKVISIFEKRRSYLLVSDRESKRPIPDKYKKRVNL